MNVLSHPEQPEVLCSITTAASLGDPPLDWRTAIQDTARLGLDRFALFLTGLQPDGRQECYRRLLALRRHHAFAIPFVHARGDMSADEYRFLAGEFGTERFNLHSRRQLRHEHPLPDDLRSRIYIENAWHIQEKDLDGFAGICLDFSHLETTLYLNPECYPGLIALIGKHPIGANHVSAFRLAPNDGGRLDRHFSTTLEDFAYLAGMPRRYFARFVAIELSNPLPFQLEVKRALDLRFIRA